VGDGVKNLLERWVILAIVKEAIEQVQRHAPDRALVINPQDQERAEHLASLMRRWAIGDEPDAAEAFHHICGIINIPPDVVRQAVRA
jgi:hypothetical protein